MHRMTNPALMFFGDPHGNFVPVIAAVDLFRPKAIVLLGDIQALQPLHVELAPILDKTQIWFIHGNHDTDSNADYDNLWGSELAHRNLHGRVVEIAGYQVAGLCCGSRQDGRRARARKVPSPIIVTPEMRVRRRPRAARAEDELRSRCAARTANTSTKVFRATHTLPSKANCGTIGRSGDTNCGRKWEAPSRPDAYAQQVRDAHGHAARQRRSSCRATPCSG